MLIAAILGLGAGRYWRNTLLTNLKIGAATMVVATVLMASPVLATGGGHGGWGGHGGPGGCHWHCGGPGGPPGSGVPLPIAGAGLLALIAGGYVLSRRGRRTDESE
jgi:hypothetical protein